MYKCIFILDLLALQPMRRQIKLAEEEAIERESSNKQSWSLLNQLRLIALSIVARIAQSIFY